MADNLPDTIENLLLTWLFTSSAATRPTTPLRLRLMTANGSDSANGTELSTSGGYTAGGATITFGAAASGQIANSADVSWTNMPAATIVGVEIWDTAGSPVRLAYGALAASKTTSSGDTFTVSTGALTFSLA